MLRRQALNRITERPRPAATRRANTLVLVTAILVLLVIIATAFLVRSQSGRAQAAAQQRVTGREARVEALGAQLAQMVADALFVRRVDRDFLAAQQAANVQTGLPQDRPDLGFALARSDFPRREPLPLDVRYGVDPLDAVDNRSFVPNLGQGEWNDFPPGDGYVDGYNFAPFETNPITNWPDRYGEIPLEGRMIGNPGFGDSRWLASSEPVRAMVVNQMINAIAPAPPGPRDTPDFGANWSNLALQLQPSTGRPTNSPILSPEGLGFSHWAHLSWIATAENGFRLCWNISTIDGLPNPADVFDFAGLKQGSPGTALGELALGVPYEQWLPFVAPREPSVTKDLQTGYLVLDPADWKQRVRDWFNVGQLAFPADPLAVPLPHQQIITGNVGPGATALQRYARMTDALPNFLQLGAFGPPADEFIPNTSRNLIARSLADADGDGWTDSLWFLAPSSSDRGTRQLVAVRIVDNSGMINVNTSTRFERSNTIGQTPSDVALVSRRESYAETGGTDSPGRLAALRDPAVGFLNAPENDPEYRANFMFVRPGGGAPEVNRLVYAVSRTPGTPSPTTVAPTGGIDVGWEPRRWEGGWAASPANTGGFALDPYQPTVLETLGLVTPARTGESGNGLDTSNRLIPLFDTATALGITGSDEAYGDMFALTRPDDRLTYFKAMANGGELIDPITASRIATLTPFGIDDEIELRSSNGLNSPQMVSRLEIALNDPAAVPAGQTRIGQFLRSSRSREETVRFLDPDDVRTQDWRARASWTPGATFPISTLFGNGSVGAASRSGAELLLDHRRLMTTISGARNEVLPPRLWSAQDPTQPAIVAASYPAFHATYVDFNGDRNGDGTLDNRPDGRPDDVNGDGTVTAQDYLEPFHPNVVFFGDLERPIIIPGPNNPTQERVRDSDKNGRIDAADYELARQEFLRRNGKIDLRRPNDVPGPDGLPASAADIASADRVLASDTQRVMRRALLVPEIKLTRQSGAWTRRFVEDSYFAPFTGEAGEPDAAAADWTKMMIASYSANLLCYRDGERPPESRVLQQTEPALDQPLMLKDAVRVPRDIAAAWPANLGTAVTPAFIGAEKQPFLMEVFIAFVYPCSKITQAELNDAVDADPGSSSNCPEAQVGQDNGRCLPSDTEFDEGENFVTFDQGDSSTWPAVVFVAQLANPYEAPVKLSDFELRINPASGASHSFRFDRTADPADPPGFVGGNRYGRDVELGPCTPEEPRTAIIFSIPDRFPNGELFPRNAWLDYLDIGAPLDRPQDGSDANGFDCGDTAPDGVIRNQEANLVFAGVVGRDFEPDPFALFEPAWGSAVAVERFGRRGTLLFDATTARATDGTLIYKGLDSSGDPRRWTPAQPGPPTGSTAPAAATPPRSFIELVRRIRRPETPLTEGDAVVVDRWENELNPDVNQGADPATTQRFADRVYNLLQPIADGGSQPPARSITCIPGQKKFRIPHIALGPRVEPPLGFVPPAGVDPGDDLVPGNMWVTWARASRQWLLDTQIPANQAASQPPAPGRGIITMDERTPRWVFARTTGCASTTREELQRSIPADGGTVGTNVKGEVMSAFSPPDREPGVGGSPRCRWPTNEQYVNIWGYRGRGKPVFFPTRTIERLAELPIGSSVVRTYRYPRWRPDTAGRQQCGTQTLITNYGEKGATGGVNAPWMIPSDKNTFTAPLRFRQKDADFDQVAEILDVPMWGPMVELSVDSRYEGTWATLPEILVQRLEHMPTGQSSELKPYFPKFPSILSAGRPQGAAVEDVRNPALLPAYGSRDMQVRLNRLVLDPMQFAPSGTFVSGAQTMPAPDVGRPADPATEATADGREGVMMFQNGVGFNSRLPGGVALLDAFTVDDRGAAPFDNPYWTAEEAAIGTKSIDFAERAAAEDRRLRLVRNYEGKLTPGLINVNTAPVEVLRAMPHMTRLVYDDDFPLAKTENSNPADLLDTDSVLGRRRTIREPLAALGGGAAIQPLLQRAPFDFPNSTANPEQFNSIAFDYGVPAPRVRVAEAIDLWRSKGNAGWDVFGSAQTTFPDLPTYSVRGLGLANGLNHLEWAPGMRSERGFVSIGELAMLSRGAAFSGGVSGLVDVAFGRASDVNRNGIADGAESPGDVFNSWNRTVGWSVRSAGLDPFRTRRNVNEATSGAGVSAPIAGPATPVAAGQPLPYRIDGVPLARGPGVEQVHPLSGRTSLDKHLLTIARDDPATPIVETDDSATPAVLEDAIYRYDQTAGDAIEQNSLLKGISNIVTTRSDVFTVWVRVRTIRQDPLTGQWNGMDPENIIDDSRYMMTIDRSSVDRPGERARILSYVKVPK